MEDILRQSYLFQGIAEADALRLADSLSVGKRSYAKDHLILSAGEQVRSLGVVLAGGVIVTMTDPWGGRSVVNVLTAGDVFAETYAFAEEPLMVSVWAQESCEILFLDLRRRGIGTDAAMDRLMANLLRVLCEKNLHLSRRMRFTAPKSIRGRVIAYLSHERVRQGSAYLVLPFSRQQLADFLNVDRSALSAELGRMQRDGLIEVYRNHFKILEKGKAEGMDGERAE